MAQADRLQPKARGRLAESAAEQRAGGRVERGGTVGGGEEYGRAGARKAILREQVE